MTINRDLFEYLRGQSIQFGECDRSEANDSLLKFLRNSVEQTETIDDFTLLNKIRVFNCTLAKRWKECHKTYAAFVSKNENWLNLPFIIPTKTLLKPTAHPEVSRSKGGRPMLSFQESSERSKRRKLESKYANVSSEELLRAAHWSLVREGKRQQANIVQDVSTPDGAQRILDLVKDGKESVQVKPYTPDEAAALLMEPGMTRRLYQFLRSDLKVRCGRSIIPSYNVALEAKKRSYPPKSSIIIRNEG